MDLPVVGTALLAVALWGATTGLLPAPLCARAWGAARRLRSRQDLAVLRHDAVRSVLTRTIDPAVLDDAEARVASLTQADAIGAARAVLEEASIPRPPRGTAPVPPPLRPGGPARPR